MSPNVIHELLLVASVIVILVIIAVKAYYLARVRTSKLTLVTVPRDEILLGVSAAADALAVLLLIGMAVYSVFKRGGSALVHILLWALVFACVAAAAAVDWFLYVKGNKFMIYISIAQSALVLLLFVAVIISLFAHL